MLHNASVLGPPLLRTRARKLAKPRAATKAETLAPAVEAAESAAMAFLAQVQTVPWKRLAEQHGMKL